MGEDGVRLTLVGTAIIVAALLAVLFLAGILNKQQPDLN